ncbi:MAG: spore coat protein CotJB [Clostridiales bacterium]|nr:spore coat protein CotJB [Clostridiales bacterium]
MADRTTLLRQIDEISFTVDDLKLYLDTHPTDAQALNAFDLAMSERKQLLEHYSREYEPLTMNCVDTENNNQTGRYSSYPGQKHFTWSDGPLPWDNQGGAR